MSDPTLNRSTYITFRQEKIKYKKNFFKKPPRKHWKILSRNMKFNNWTKPLKNYH